MSAGSVRGHRIWATEDGRHVLDGHLDAAVLAYGPADDVPDSVVVEGAEAKQKPAAANKMRGRSADKSA